MSRKESKKKKGLRNFVGLFLKSFSSKCLHHLPPQLFFHHDLLRFSLRWWFRSGADIFLHLSFSSFVPPDSIPVDAIINPLFLVGELILGRQFAQAFFDYALDRFEEYLVAARRKIVAVVVVFALTHAARFQCLVEEIADGCLRLLDLFGPERCYRDILSHVG